MLGNPPILDLADELLAEVLAFLLDHKAERGRNGHAEREHPIRRGESCDLDRFRLVCKRFMHIGTPRKFSRFSVLFSKRGLRRVDDLVDMQRACNVRTLTYFVRPFWKGSGTSPLSPSLGKTYGKATRC